MTAEISAENKFFPFQKNFLGKIKKGFLDKGLFRAFYPKGTPCEVQKKNFNYLGFPFKMKFRLRQKYIKCFYLKFLFKSSIFDDFYLKNFKKFLG